ncbi:MAG: hypothetical protein ACRDAM_09960 [Casimicrobium sp.]
MNRCILRREKYPTMCDNRPNPGSLARASDDDRVGLSLFYLEFTASQGRKQDINEPSPRKFIETLVANAMGHFQLKHKLLAR